LRKKLIKRYQLCSEIILTEDQLIPFYEGVRINNVNKSIWLSLGINNLVIPTEIKRTNYRINPLYDDHEFEAVYFNGWNYNSLNQYINLMIGGTKKNMYILINGLPIRNRYQPIEDINGIKSFLVTVTDQSANDFPTYLISSLKDLELRGIMIKGINFKRAVYAWDKLTINYALSIWVQRIVDFPRFNYIIYNN
jgi:hypothetical protein